MLSGLASSAKYLKVINSKRSRRMESCKQKRNAINLLHTRSLEEEALTMPI